MSSLELFCQPVQEWFRSNLGRPTDIQEKAWPVIAAGGHALISAPTGSGKTLTAFLWSLDRLIREPQPPGRLKVLYISPLRALGNDIRRNLLLPLEQLQDHLSGPSNENQQIRVEIRSGDTPQKDRRRMLKNPPDILITTPESLNILLTSVNGRELLADVETVILDEIHAIAESKRGVHLMTAIERLVLLCGEFQRIALSATIHPAERIATWIGGRIPPGTRDGDAYRKRPVDIVRSDSAKRYDLQIRLPSGGAQQDRQAFWSDFAHDIKKRIRDNRSTLIFANSRRMVEKIARLINEHEDEQLAYSHHGSLSREIRSIVEERMKQGQLKAVVATNSLELGIDIGAIDEVILVQAPPSIASAVQRLGRAGHGVGETSRGRLLPVHAQGLIDAAVIAAAVDRGDIEEIRPISGALDVLAQVLLSMLVAEPWNADELFDFIRCTDAYSELSRRQFDLVLEMMAGRFTSNRLRALRPQISIDGIDGSLRARPGADRLVYLSGGTIADRGYYQLRLHGESTRIGELDEEFVWERSPGDTFTLGVQTWRIESISHSDVFVTPANAASAMAPFWRAEERDRSFFLSERIGRFLEWANTRLDNPDFLNKLRRTHHLSAQAARELRRQLVEQRQLTGTLPHRHQVLIESTRASSGRSHEKQLILITMWGGRVNRPLAAALATAWERRYGRAPGIMHDDSCVVITYPAQLERIDPLDLLRPENIDELIHAQLHNSGFFGAKFREAAGCALLLPRAGYRKRIPLWVHRQRAKELLEAVSPTDDFPIVLEAWRSCLQDEFEVEALKQLLVEIRESHIDVQWVETERPSPFAANVLWKQTNDLMYQDDTPTHLGARPRADLLREVALSSHLRPRIDTDLIADLESKLQRTADDYSPATAQELFDWIRERVMLPLPEYTQLCAAIERDHGVSTRELATSIASRSIILGDVAPVVVAIEDIPRILALLDQADPHCAPLTGGDSLGEHTAELVHEMRTRASSLETKFNPADVISEWLRFYGPRRIDWIASTLDLDHSALEDMLEELAVEQVVVTGAISSDSAGDEVCDRDNLERLLRLTRAKSRSAFSPVDCELLPLHLACQQGVSIDVEGSRQLEGAVETLFGFPAGAALWEQEILPARIADYRPEALDRLLSETGLRWVGSGARRIYFSFDDDRELFSTPQAADLPELFPQPYGRYSVEDIGLAGSMSTSTIQDLLWDAAWEGKASTDTLSPLRNALESNFRDRPQNRSRRPGFRRSRLDRWQRSHIPTAHWFRLADVGETSDALLSEELNKERARIAIERYGVVFRRLLERETPPLAWSRLFRSLRLLELSGDIVAGHFIRGIEGLQFASHRALRQLADLPEDRIWWINASDPASPCGLGVGTFPRRIPSTHLVFHGRRLVMTSEKSGKTVTIDVSPDHPELESYLEVFRHLLTRPVQPRKHITIEAINQTPAARSPFREVLAKSFHTTGFREGLRITRQY